MVPLVDGPLALRKPGLRHGRDHRKHGALRKPEEALCREQRDEQCRAGEHDRRERSRDGGDESDEADDRIRDARAEPLAQDASRQLRERVTRGERGIEPADLHLREMQVRHDVLRRDAQARALHVRQHREAAQEQENGPANLHASPPRMRATSATQFRTRRIVGRRAQDPGRPRFAQDRDGQRVGRSHHSVST